MNHSRRKDARHYPILKIVPAKTSVGIQIVYNRVQAYVVWNYGEIEEFCDSLDRAYFVLQDILDGNRTGEDYEEDEDEEDGGTWD
jgi:hypothetical protein